MNRTAVWGLTLSLVSAFLFAAAAPFAKAMYTTGWTPGSVVLLRLLGCALVLAAPVALAVRRMPREFVRNAGTLVLYGVIAMAGVQLFYFMSVEHLAVSLALLLEMTAPVMIVLWVWMRTGTRPDSRTFLGIALAMGGLVLVLDPRGARLDPLSVGFALAAAVCLSFFFLASAKGDLRIPPVALTGVGMGVGGATVGLLLLAGVVPAGFSAAVVDVGFMTLPWWGSMSIIVLVTAGAYAFGVIGIRLIGATVSSFVNLVEVPFSVVVAWIVLAEMPVYMQILGGVLVLAGVVFIKLGENRAARRDFVDAVLVEVSAGAVPAGVD
ncbi:DMT family transporter, partial [Brevibacterium samyangense]